MLMVVTVLSGLLQSIALYLGDYCGFQSEFHRAHARMQAMGHNVNG
jgi:hypothetical protein